MAVLTREQVYLLAVKAGATPDEARVLTAIAAGESGWNTQAHNPVGRDNSYGLWQINMLGDMGAARRQQFGIASNEELWNPQINAKAAVAILRSQGWKAWSVYTNGTYKSYLDGNDPTGGNVGEYLGGDTAGAGAAYNPAAGLPPNASPQQIEDYVREHYPQAAGFLDIPELRQVLIDAARGQYSPDKLQGVLQATSWWRKNADATRSYWALKSTDPAQLKALIDQKVAELTPQMKELGLTADPRFIAEGALKYGWTQDQIQATFANLLSQQSGADGLQQASAPDLTADKLMQMARVEYLVPISRQDAERWAIDIFRGNRTEEAMRDYFGRLAASRFPGLIEQGFTPGDYMAPIRNLIAETLEVSPTEVDFLDRRYAAVLEIEGKDGKMRPMSLAEAGKWARSQPAYQQTKGALDEAAQFADTLGRTFGSVA